VWLRVAVDVVAPGQVRIGGVEGVPLWTHNNHWDVERRRGELPDVRVIPLDAVEDAALRDERLRAITSVLGDVRFPN